MQEYNKASMYFHEMPGPKAFVQFKNNASGDNLEQEIIKAYEQAGSLFMKDRNKEMSLIDNLSDKNKVYYSNRVPMRGDLVLELDKEKLKTEIRLKIIGMVDKFDQGTLYILALDKKGKVDLRSISNWHACAYIDF